MRGINLAGKRLKIKRWAVNRRIEQGKKITMKQINQDIKKAKIKKITKHAGPQPV